MTDRCGCCAPTAAPMPMVVDNRPGLSAIAYRAGTYSSFLEGALTRIARFTHPQDEDYPWVLRDLHTRASEDYAITLLELWATIADILSFYEERLANESFLRTATRRDSVLRLARLVGYELRPGVAATTQLAFTLEPKTKLLLPDRLRVQSVPLDGETPQKFETSRSIWADGRFNRLAVLPKPMKVDPLAQGSTRAYLAPDASGLKAAATLKPGDSVLITDALGDATAKVAGRVVESLTVRAVRPDGELMVLSWSTPISSAKGTADGLRMYKYGRVFRIFGHDAPESYGTFVSSKEPPGVDWTLRQTPKEYPALRTAEDSISLFLDRRYENLKVGTRLLIYQNNANYITVDEVTVMSVDQASDEIAAIAQTVSRVWLDVKLPPISNRRNVLVYELTGDEIPFWEWQYPYRLLGSACWIPGHRTGWSTIEIGRTIVNGQYAGGVELDVKEIDHGRSTLLVDGGQLAISATITNACLWGTNLRFAPTDTDPNSAAELGLANPETLELTVLASGVLPASPTIRNPRRELFVTIGTVGPRRVSFARPTGGVLELALTLESAIQSADPATEFGKARVLAQNDLRLVVVAGVPGLPIAFAPTPDDPTTIVDLQLDSARAQFVGAVLSRPLDPFPTISATSPEMNVTVGPEEPARIFARSPLPIDSLSTAVSWLKAAMLHAPGVYAFPAHVENYNGRLLVVPGLPNFPVHFIVLDLRSENPIDLDARTAALLGNVVPASHGESVRNEIVGSADASAVFQRFPLKKKPLTFVPGAGATGTVSSLEVLVNGVLWSEVPTLYGHRENETVYVTRLSDDATTTFQFPDGRTGARPPSGVDNIVARYRQGSGLAGRLRAGALSNLLDRPVGVKAVTNPAATDGGADAETSANARRNAPTTVRTFGRAISLRDFVDIAMASGEVAKASATWVWSGDTRAIYLTVAAQLGGRFSQDGLARIYAIITSQRDPNHSLEIGNFVPVPIVIAATLHVEPTRVTSAVLKAARESLTAALGFEAMEFGQAVHLSDMYRILQSVAGVEYIDIDMLHFKDRSASNLNDRGVDSDPVQEHLRIFPARIVSGRVIAAEQAWIEVPTQDLTLLASGGLPD
jgi:hypothetical protein